MSVACTCMQRSYANDSPMHACKASPMPHACKEWQIISVRGQNTSRHASTQAYIQQVETGAVRFVPMCLLGCV